MWNLQYKTPLERDDDEKVNGGGTHKTPKSSLFYNTYPYYEIMEINQFTQLLGHLLGYAEITL